MMHTTQALYDNLGVLLLEINKQIDAVKRSVMAKVPADVEPNPDVIYFEKNSDGTFVLTDLLAAKAQVLSGMAALKAADVASKAPGPKKGHW